MPRGLPVDYVRAVLRCAAYLYGLGDDKRATELLDFQTQLSVSRLRAVAREDNTEIPARGWRELADRQRRARGEG